jgi:hypothetical protein
MSFTVFADYPCHVRYVESAAVPLGEDSVDVYAIDPAPYGRWVVVQIRQGEQRHLMFYIRTGNAFPEKPPDRIPARLRREISLRILSLKETPRWRFDPGVVSFRRSGSLQDSRSSED